MERLAEPAVAGAADKPVTEQALRRSELPREPALIAGRYRCLRTLGSGGTADVFEALDLVQGRHVALKLLRTSATGGPSGALARGLFEREFHLLAQLQHPSVVSVLDYGVAAEGRFYTMELLEGSDLASVAPLPWRRACSLLRDICSVLALLHSRRLVYRDLTARNLFCSSTGACKLIDFGALLPMGTADDVVGSPPFVPPEALSHRALDAQSDLFAAGATLYFALTGQLLFPARTFAELPLCWQLPRRPPSALVPDIPPELDALVLDLVQLDPQLRPRSAGEVIDRLEAIAGLEHADQQLVARPYLGTPELVEREELLASAVRCLRLSREGRGAALLVTGADGTGRSRLLDACVLQAKLLGTSTLVLQAHEGQGAYAGARALAAQLLQLEPALAAAALEPHRAVLGHVLPELLEGRAPSLARFADPRDARPAIQAALRSWLQAVARQRPLAVAIDDIDQLDEPSAALVALLAVDAAEHPLLVLASLRSRGDAVALPLSVLQRAASSWRLTHLTEAGTRRLLASMFGDTPRLELVAARVHALADGNPRDVVQLARTLVENQTIRWEAGGWALPSVLHADALPGSVSDGLRARIRALSEHGLRLARLLALSQLPALTFQQFLRLSDGDAAVVMQGIGELVEADLLRFEGQAQQLSLPGWRELLLADMSSEPRAELHRRLAALLAELPEYPLRSIQQLRWAGDEAAALERLTAFCATSSQQTAADPARFIELVERLPRDWYELLDWGAQRLKATGSRAAVCALQGRMAGILPIMNPYLGAQHLSELIARLCQDAGLADSAPGHERVFPPPVALRQLAQILIAAAAIVATTYDYELWRQGPRLEPLHASAPALQVVSSLWQGLGERMAGRLEAAVQQYERVEALLAQPDRCGVDPSHATYTRLGVAWGIGMLQAMMGQDQCLRQAELLSSDPWHRASGILVHMLHGYWQADPARGDAEKKRWLLSMIESKSRRWFEGVHLLAELSAHALSDDLERLKGVLPDLRNLAELASGWRPIYDHALGEYHRLRGDLTGALGCFERARTAGPGTQHQIWALAAGAELRTLLLLGRAAAALSAGERYLELAREAGLGQLALHVRIPLARASADSGQLARARSAIDGVLVELERDGVRGLMPGWAHETSAQIALAAGDAALAQRALEACSRELRASENPLGRRRCERLAQALDALCARHESAQHARQLARARSALAACSSARERAAAALDLLLEQTGASGGILQLVSGESGADTAELGLGAERQLAEQLLRNLLAGLLHGGSSETAAGTSAHLATVTALHEPLSVRSSAFAPVLLRHGPHASALTGVALLKCARGRPLAEAEALAAALSRALSAEACAQVPGM